MALTVAVCAAVTVEAPLAAGIGGCGAALGDYRGEFTAAEDSANVLTFDGAGGIAFRGGRAGTGEGIYAVIPSGGFSATLRMTGGGAPTSMVKSVTFACPAPGTQVASFRSLDENSARFTYARSK
ncbi:hypothetical protein D7D52_07385 [Nocardia yunnanensis]|uniref:Uncharacterized protein n=1 Tax=Nocardia yunnanensis TaxID=2382165 RepID=A0A386Z7W0_9NOCA|nr:hypothetical protein [Nocardia yunnanensis]AYF73708.1 hypothetical protein D7D52_07385 [Nocardia yunnanensis]